MEELLHNYTNLNNSFKKKLVFNIGTEAGFFSEYNYMILAMLYCLDNKIKFTLFSKNANFRYKNGWTDYFLPFCEENRDNFHIKHNFRWTRYIYRRERPPYILYKWLRNVDYFTFDIWEQIRDRHLENKQYTIPELGINGDIQDACRVLIDLTWKYNSYTQERVDKLVSSVSLPQDYIGLQIRSGDKFVEAELLGVSAYIDKLQSISDLQDVFILTDDYRIIETLQNNYPFLRIKTLCEEHERGYFHQKFEKEDRNIIKNAHERLFASMDILSRSQKFIGTFSANPGMYLGMRMPKGSALSIDIDKWQIWL